MWKRTKSGVWVPKHLFAETAAPLHWISTTIAIIALLISLGSFQTARQALNTSRQTLRVGQRAYLSVVEVKYAADAAPQIHDTDPQIHIADPRVHVGELQIHLKNSGNTPGEIRPLALRVVAMGQTQFQGVLASVSGLPPSEAQFNEVMRLSKRLPLINVSKDIPGKEDGWLNVACDKHHLTDWNGLPDRIVVAALLQYRDVFGEPHFITWGWFMDKLQVTREVDHLAVELLLAPRFPSDVDFTPPENPRW